MNVFSEFLSRSEGEMRETALTSMNEISEVAISHYSNNCEDIRKCPNPDCSHYGIIPKGACSDSLQCLGCGF